MDRRRQELQLLEQQFVKLSIADDLSWFIIEAFPLPPGRYNRDTTRLLHFIGPGYPQTPPDNFLVPSGLRTASNVIPASYQEGQNHFGQQWGVFSWHAKVWAPALDHQQGDNLLTFIMSANKRLWEGEP